MSTQRLRRAVIALIVGFVAVLAPIVPVAAQSDSSSAEAGEAPAPVEAPAPANTALSVWRVYVDSAEDGARLANSGFDLLEGRGDGYLLVLGENDVAVALRQDGFRVERDRELSPLPGVGRNRIEEHGHRHEETSGLEAEMSVAQALTYYGGYRTVVEHYAHLDSVAATYPGLATVYDYGDSWLKTQGRSGANDLKVICLTNKQAGDCALSPTSAKPRATIMAAIHARELQTSEMAWRLIDHLTQGYGVDPDVTHMMDTTEIWIIPVANPDGREIVESGGNSPYLQRKNANDSAGSCSIPPTSSNHYGVDLNRNASTHNYGGIGTTTNPCAQTYRGTGPASEPEQQALEALFRNLWPDQKGAPSSAAPDTATGTFITIHSSSELILLPPGEGGIAPNDDQLRAYAFRMSHYNGYETGTGPEILYGVTGSTDDWVYYDLGVASVTYELSPQSGTCGGFTPAYSCMDALWNLNRDALLYAAKVAETPYITSRGPTTTSASSDGSVEQGTAMTVTAVVNDNAYGTSGFSRPTAQTVTEAEYYLDVSPSDGGTPVAMSAADGSFNQNNETATASIDTTGLALGDHTVFVRGRNAAGFWGPIQATSFTVTAPVDDPPTADDQSVFTPEDTALSITLTGSDPEGQPITYSVTGGPSNGSLSGTAPNLIYTPNAGFSGSDSFTFTTNDGGLTSAPGTVSISVGVPIGPIFSDDFETNLGWTTDPDGTDTATTGQWEVGNPDQTSSGITLQLGTTTSGSQALVTGAAGGSSAGTWDIDNGDTTVRSPDIALPAGAVLDLSFQYNFAHLNNGSVDDYLRVSVVGPGGSTTVLEQTGDGSERAGAWTSFNVDVSSFAGQTVHLLIEAADAAGGSLIEAAIDDLVIESLGASNSAPTADAQSVSLDEDTSSAVTLTGSDPDGDALSFSVTGGPSNGSLSGTAPNLTYTPDANFNGADSFTFVVNDGTVDSAPATVNITVNPVNDLPTTSPVSVTTDEEVPVAVTLLGDDVDGDALTYGISGGPTNGSLSGTAPNLTYTPDVGFIGTDSFSYQASDNGGATWSAASTVTITVENVNEAPSADDQSVSLDEDTSLAITLTGSDPDGDALSFSVTGGPSNGSLSGSAPNLTYTPDANFNGADSFTFVANDGEFDSNTATVSITVNPVNDLPTTSPVSVTTDEGVAVTITLVGDDVDGDALTYGASGGPSNGTLTGIGAERVYTPDPGFVGVDTFAYQVSDNGGATWSAASTVTITVENVNEAPSADDQSVSLDEDTSLAITLTGSDPDGDALSFSVTGGPSNGSLSGSAPNLTYTPDANFNGADSFTFVANDGEFDSNTATVSITVNPVNDLPTTSPVSVTTDEGVAVTITLVGDDVDGDALTYGASGGPSNGTLTGIGAERVYTPDPGFVGVDTFAYQVSDNGGATWSAASTVTITVNEVAGGLPFNDDFESGSGNWSSLIGGGGTWSLITDGSEWFEGSVSGRNDVSAQVAGDSAWSDYAFEAQVLTSNVVRRGDGPALLARVQDANNHYRFRFENRRWIIEEVVGGSVTKLAQSSRTNLGSGTNTIRVEVLGTSLQMFVNGSLVVSTTDSTFSTGQIGIGVHGATAQFDNVAVTALP